MVPAKITTHVADGLQRLLTQYQNSTRFQAFLRPFLHEIQAAEDAFYDCLWRLDLTLITGQQLDDFGTIVGLSRAEAYNAMGASGDAVYAFALRGQMLANVSQGGTEGAVEFIKAYLGLGDETSVIVYQSSPDDITVVMPGVGWDAPALRFFLKQMLPANKKLIFSALSPTVNHHHEWFAFDGPDATVFDSQSPCVGGFGDATDLGSPPTTGGSLILTLPLA